MWYNVTPWIWKLYQKFIEFYLQLVYWSFYLTLHILTNILKLSNYTNYHVYMQNSKWSEYNFYIEICKVRMEKCKIVSNPVLTIIHIHQHTGRDKTTWEEWFLLEPDSSANYIVAFMDKPHIRRNDYHRLSKMLWNKITKLMKLFFICLELETFCFAHARK